jgi:hypothetical protein
VIRHAQRYAYERPDTYEQLVQLWRGYDEPVTHEELIRLSHPRTPPVIMAARGVLGTVIASVLVGLPPLLRALGG